MNYLSQLLRFFYIQYTLLLILFSQIPVFNKNKMLRGRKIRLALENLGPLFIKFGQLLSTRHDLLPKDIIQELSLLQDKVAPFDGLIAKSIIEKELKAPLEDFFKNFNVIPLASASIAQVHKAELFNGNTVIIKVLRPNIHRLIKRDIALLKSITRFIQFFYKKSKAFKAYEIVLEFETALLNELDLMREAANASHLKRNFTNSPLLYVPEIHWSQSTKNIVVMEEITGIPIYQTENLEKLGFDFKKLAEGILEIFFTQVFRDRFFHADMHPGNIFVCGKNIENPKFITVDFGIMGTLSLADQNYLAENFLALFNRNYQRIAELHQKSGWLSEKSCLSSFETSLRTICEPIFERPLSEISFGGLLLQLFQIAHQHKINIQPQLILLQKTLMNVEGLARHLYPKLDLWTTAKPFLETWTKKQMQFSTLIQKMKSQAPYWLDKLPEIPSLLYNFIEQQTYAKDALFQPPAKIVIEVKTSKKDIFVGILLGLALSLVIVVAKLRGYF